MEALEEEINKVEWSGTTRQRIEASDPRPMNRALASTTRRCVSRNDNPCNPLLTGWPK